VQSYFFRDFTDRFPAGRDVACECGSHHRLTTRTTLVSENALAESAGLLSRQLGPGSVVWVLSDENTEAAAGARWKGMVTAGRIRSRILPGAPKPHPTAGLVDELSSEVVAQRPDLLVAVGGGVVSDLVKRVSLLRDIPNWCVATAPSVDAFSSARSAILVDGFHSSVPARVSDMIVCDLGVMERAPREMFLAGLGDLLAKFLAHLDWNLARIVTGEWYCPVVAATALGSARSALSAARQLSAEPARAVRTLTDAALSSGFAMQAMANSRSAASAEHTLAHFWETTHAARVAKFDLHGVFAGVASGVMLSAYRAFYERIADFTPDVAGRCAAFQHERPWRETVEEGLLPFMGKVNAEMAERHYDTEILAGRLAAFANGRAEILDLARRMLDEVAAAVDVLRDLGFPLMPKDVGLGTESVMLPLRNARLLRGRYSTFDLAYELGLESVPLEAAGRYIEKS
jgi:glycerol-1-phosphate dehydrogenase [NAD(P)+]